MNYKNLYIQEMLHSSEEEKSESLFSIPSEDGSPEVKNAADIEASDLPILPLKNTVLFPGVIIPVTVGRQKSIRLVKKAYQAESVIGVIAQSNLQVDEPKPADLYQVGTVAQILKLLKLPDGNITIIIQGQQRFAVNEFAQEQPYLTAKVKLKPENFPPRSHKEAKALLHTLKDSATKIMRLNPDIPQEAQIAVENIDSLSFMTHFLCTNINAEVSEKQGLLEIDSGEERTTALLEFMNRDIQLLEIKREIQNKVHTDIDQQQRDYFIRQQIKALQDELGDVGADKEVDDLRMRGRKKKWDDKTHQLFLKELDRLQRLNPMSAEYPMAMSYVELMVDLPWGEYTKDSLDLKKAQTVLDKDHYGLDKVKERIIEYLAVLKLKQTLKGPIICLYGPPGVGKTSLGKSIAKALNRKYVRMSLGGVHDEAEIRGHRRTYVGAMPGKVVQNLKKVNAANPVFILDEIDKVSSSLHGDPASALLEVLDPEQNNAFMDNYLDTPFDLSKVLFIATANSLDTIHPALRDRMEIIEINGYTLEEKIEIAKKYLIPKQLKEHGLKKTDLKFDRLAIQTLVEHYTRESGVRNLERQVGNLIRKTAKMLAMEEPYQKNISTEEVKKLLGAVLYEPEDYEDLALPGVATGLAWTQVGGEILFIESNLSRGNGKLTLSGQLGDVMKESATTAFSYLKSIADDLQIDYRLFEQYDLHLHIPAGAVPKDGPSAGITMLTSLASLLTRRSVRGKLAMTGEITLRGKVLPVGGIQEKILAAKRAGVTEVILSEKNRKDIEEIRADYIKNLTFHYVRHAQEVLTLALQPQIDKKTPSFVFKPVPEVAQ